MGILPYKSFAVKDNIKRERIKNKGKNKKINIFLTFSFKQLLQDLQMFRLFPCTSYQLLYQQQFE